MLTVIFRQLYVREKVERERAELEQERVANQRLHQQVGVLRRDADAREAAAALASPTPTQGTTSRSESGRVGLRAQLRQLRGVQTAARGTAQARSRWRS